MAERLVLSFSSEDVHAPTPWPVGIDMSTGRVISGLGPDDGAHLVGFGPAGEQTVTVYLAAAAEDLSVLVGMTATFSKDDQLFLWNVPISEAGIRQVATVQPALNIQQSGGTEDDRSQN